MGAWGCNRPDHIQTTHIGSLLRPHDLLDLMKAKFAGQKIDEAALEAKIRSSVKS
jgi:5-methyltetrahydropteroyltriglutamate--homocysteine methyltransferase